ncbi:MAG: hypothetical protein GX958_02545 [Desulfitobacterium sp.]|nr:hypothetical protein [Desulfitobacterium sp.]
MQTFFKENPEINQWVDLLVEKLITINILNGKDADSEFHESRLLVENIAKAFQEILHLPQEALIDGIQQLVEQKLPDQRVVENFPDFFLFMHKVILSGLQSLENNQKEIIPQQVANLKQLKDKYTNGTSTSKVILNGSLSVAQEIDSSFSLREHLLKSMEVYNGSLSDNVSINKISINKEILELDESSKDSDSKNSLLENNLSIENEAADDLAKTSLTEVPMAELSEEIFQLSEPLEKESQQINFQVGGSRLLESEVLEAQLKDSQLELSDLMELQIDGTELDKSHIEISQHKKSALEDIQKEYGQPEEFQEQDLSIEESITKESFPALSTAILEEPKEFLATPKLPPRDPFRFNKRKRAKDGTLGRQPNTDDTLIPVPEENSKISQKPQQETPENCRGLEQALMKVFPQRPISWYVTIEEHSFLARCESTLIFLSDQTEEVAAIFKKMKALGYEVVVFRNQDLFYPRRLERALRLRSR